MNEIPINLETSDLQSDLNDYADDLFELDKNSITANRLVRLSNDLQDNPRDWFQVDLLEMFNADNIRNYLESSFEIKTVWTSRLEMIRNALIFLPVVLTWLALSESVQVYNAVIKSRPELMEENFLFLWQNGFYGNLSRLFIFSNVAYLDAGIILLIIALTVIIMIRNQNHVSDFNSEASQLAVQLDQLLWRAKATIDEKKKNEMMTSEQKSIALLEKIDNFVYEFSSHSHELEEMIELEKQRINNLADSRQKELEDFKVFSTDLRRVSENLGQFGTKFLTTLQDFQVSANELKNETVRLGQTQSQFLNVIQGIEGHFENFDKTVLQFSQIQQRSADDLVNASAQNQMKAGELSDSVDILNAAIRSLVNQQGDYQTFMDEQTRSTDGWVDSLQKSMSQISSFTNLIDVFKDNIQTLSNQIKIISQSNESAGDKIQGVVSSFNNQMKQDIAVNQAAVKGIRELVEEMRQLTSAVNQANKGDGKSGGDSSRGGGFFGRLTDRR